MSLTVAIRGSGADHLIGLPNKPSSSEHLFLKSEKLNKTLKFYPTLKFCKCPSAKMSQDPILVNTNTNTNTGSAPTMEDLMCLLRDQSKNIGNLQRTIDGLNETIKSINDKIEKLEHSKEVPESVVKGVSKDVLLWLY